MEHIITSATSRDSRRGERQSESERARKRVRVSARESEREWHGILFKEPNPNREPPKRPS